LKKHIAVVWKDPNESFWEKMFKCVLKPCIDKRMERAFDNDETDKFYDLTHGELEA